MWRKLKAGRKVGCFYAKRTDVRWCSQLTCIKLHSSKARRRAMRMWNDNLWLNWFKDMDTLQEMGGCQSQREPKYLLFFKHDGEAALVVWISVCECVCVTASTPLQCLPRNSLHDLSFCSFRALKKYLPKVFSLLKTTTDRDVIAVQIMPHGSNNRPWADYFHSKQTGLWGVCWRPSRMMGGTTGRVSEAFLRLRWGTPEDQGNEIGQWKECFDKLRLKSRCCYPWLFLGMETESFSGRHTDTDMEEKRFLKKVKSNAMSEEDLNVGF